MGNYAATENNAGAYKLLKDKILASVLALGLAGCATGLDAKFQLRSQSDPTKTRTESFEVGKKLAVENLSEYLGRPWDALPWNRYLIDRGYHTPSWAEADRVICEKGGLRKAAEQALNAYIASPQEGADLIDATRILHEITKAGCEDYSQRGLSNALSKVPSNQLLEPLANRAMYLTQPPTRACASIAIRTEPDLAAQPAGSDGRTVSLAMRTCGG